MSELSYPPYGPRETQFDGTYQPAAFSWPNISLPTSGMGPYVAGAGYGLEALAQLAQGIQARRRASAPADYNAEVAEANAQGQAQAAEIEALQLERQAAIARQDQDVLVRAAAYREMLQRRQNERIIGQTRAIIAASGLMMSGSPLAALEESALNMGRDVLATRYQAKMQGRALEDQATMAEYGADLARYGGAERLRIGRQAGAVIRESADTSQATAGLLKATSTAARGVAAYNYLSERQKNSSLLYGP